MNAWKSTTVGTNITLTFRFLFVKQSFYGTESSVSYYCFMERYETNVKRKPYDCETIKTITQWFSNDFVTSTFDRVQYICTLCFLTHGFSLESLRICSRLSVHSCCLFVVVVDARSFDGDSVLTLAGTSAFRTLSTIPWSPFTTV